MFWNIYPYSNLHELNLDWLLDEVKKLNEKVNNLPEIQRTNIAVNVLDFGVDNTGNSDVSSAVQNIVNSAEIRNIYFPQGKYLFNKPLYITKPTNIFGASDGWISANTNGSGEGTTTFISNGFTCLNIASPSLYLKGVNISNILFDCRYNNYGIVATSTIMCNFHDITIRNVTAAGILINCYDNVLSQFNTIYNYDFIYGTTPENSACGIILNGGETRNVTQTYIYNNRCLVQSGYSLKILNSDNNICAKLFGNLYLGANADNNVIFYMAGKVKSEGGNKGNTCLLYNNEGGGVDIDSTSSFNYAMVNYTDGTLYTNQNVMRKKLYYNINKQGTNNVDFTINLNEFDRNHGLAIYGGNVSVIANSTTLTVNIYGIESAGAPEGTLLNTETINIFNNYYTITNSLVTCFIDPKYSALKLVLTGATSINLVSWEPEIQTATNFEGRIYQYK